jgi:hypothetical protein
MAVRGAGDAQVAEAVPGCGSEDWQNGQAEDLGWWHTPCREGRPWKQTANQKNWLRPRFHPPPPELSTITGALAVWRWRK